jgi:hypothetical protein
MDALTPWEVLEERANRAILESRFLVGTHKCLLDQLTQNYRRRFDAAHKAILQTQGGILLPILACAEEYAKLLGCERVLVKDAVDPNKV